MNVKIILKILQQKKGESAPSSFSMSTMLSFKSIENKRNLYRSKDYIKMF